jgi:guanylate kinase
MSKLLMLVGPSGVGKGSIVSELRKVRSDVWLSVSATTREPRTGEVDGEHYFFVSQAEFDLLIARNDLLEWAEYAGHRYGTPKQEVISKLESGLLVVLEIELAGARQVKKQMPEVLDVMVLPPSISELEARLTNRGTEDPQEVRTRLALASMELGAQGEFSHLIVNDTVSHAMEQLIPLLPPQKS